jgi:predicted  nucleic acid-binding Zn-ribbon protein
MKRLALALLLAACSERDDKLEQARRSAAIAKENAVKAEADAAAAQKKLDETLQEQQAAVDSMQKAGQELEAARRQTAALIAVAKQKLEQLKAKRDAETDATKRAVLSKQIDDLEKAIAQ